MTVIDFKNYILRKLGYPLHTVELTDEQIFDCITEAVQRFTERHYDAVIMRLYKLDLKAGQSFYELPHHIKTVINIFPSNTLTSAMDNFEKYLIPLTPLAYYDYIWQLSDITTLTMWRYSTQMWEDNITNQNIRFDFNSTMHRLEVQGDINHIMENFPTNSFYLLTYDSPIEEMDDLYENRWLKKYATALCKEQWATNLKKYNNAPLAGGAELNHEGLMADAKEQIEKLEEQLEDEYTLPPSFIKG